MTNGGQLYNWFLSCGLGFLMGIYYDVYRVIRLVMHPSKWVVLAQDMLFFGSAAIITFFFALTVSGGEMRLYLFAGLLIGFAAYYWTVGRLVVHSARRIIRLILAVWHWLWWLLLWPFRQARRLLSRVLRRPLLFLREKAKKTVQKFALFFKKGLQPLRLVLYNRKESKYMRDDG